MRIAHISDLHVGKSWMFDEDLLKRAIGIINASDVGGVLITGDLTDWGIESEYEQAEEILKTIKKRLFIVPGNHDARIAGYKMFKRLFSQGKGRFFNRVLGNVLLIGLDSSEPDIDDGHIGREQLAWLEERLSENSKKLRPKIPVVALHHHLVPVPNTGRERNILVDAGEVLDVINRYSVPLVVTGHKHNPYLWKLNDTFIYSGGTVSCKRTAVSSALSFIDIGRKGLKIVKLELPERKEVMIVDHLW
jgi:3',5'-cyclic AMP phosphodiesterase CpdA